jgi:predicted RNA-binding Zn-ribbon protein involved in translation (DUF1610 family)
MRSDVTGMSEGARAGELVLEVLREARALVARPDNDFTRSSWIAAGDALREIDGLVERLEAGPVAPSRIAILFAPTGPMQELSESSGWGEQFLALARRCEEALASGEVAQAAFACAACGGQAGALELRGSRTRAELVRESFTGTLTEPLTSGAVEPLRAALAAGDAGGLFALDPEYAPFYCPTCGASYCGDHWTRWDVFDDEMPDWHDSIRGRCPHGHERMLED